MADTTGVEFIKAKVFLYKFTPKFTLSNTKSSAGEGTLGKLDRYTVDLDEKYFSKLDISDFFVGFTFDQELTGNTYSWTLQLQEKVLTLNEINQRLLVEGTKIMSMLDIANLAEYEVESKDLDTTREIIRQAKVARGVTQDAMVIKTGSNLPTVKGLRLSDFIQPYDFISIFLYKNTTPLENVRGNLVETPLPFKNTVFVLNEAGSPLTPSSLKKESVLLSQTIDGNTLFSNELNGFVMTKSVNRRQGSADLIQLAGNGITRLFGSSRKVLKSSVMQKSIFEIAQTVDPVKGSVFQNVLADGRSLEDIFAELFTLIYRIKFPAQISTNNQAQFTGSNFYDISAILVGNDLQTNMFTLPAYLLALVMRRRGFSFRAPTDLDSLVDVVRADAVKGEIDQNAVDQVLNRETDSQTKLPGHQPVFFSQELNVLRPYFKLIREVFTFFNVELKTPFEIIDEIKSKTFLEFYERPDGVIIIRPPQYNDTTNTVYSTELDVMDTTYSDSANELVSVQRVAYGCDVIEQLDAIQAYFYGNGKMLIQYGFMEAGADVNPNAKNDKVIDNDLARNKEPGLFKYAEYFLRLHNASLKTASITCNLNTAIQVGKTYYDAKNNKFGYISSVSKQCGASREATMSFTLSFVRDAYIKDTQLQFEKLDTLLDVSRKFSSTALTDVSDPFPDPVSFDSAGPALSEDDTN